MSLEEREVQRYYQPWLAAHGSSLNVAKHVESIAQLDLNRQGYQARSSRDKAITAFAQLVALRLAVRRCMVSLIDSANQYVLAEGTGQTTSTTTSDDELWLGSAILRRSDAVCEHCFTNTCTAEEEDGRIFSAKGLIVNDCRLDDRFKDRSYVKEEQGVRFYAGVPLFSRNGYMIGAIAVSDGNPRDGLKADELRLMQETAQSVMEHLEWARDRVDRFKGERIVRGMATFIEDCSHGGSRDDTTEKEQTSHQTSPKEDSRPPPKPRLVNRASARRLPKSKESKVDSMSRMFLKAADILRESTLADGAAIFGATATSGPAANTKAPPANLDGIVDTPDTSDHPSPASGSEAGGHDTGTSDSDSAPASRPCKILAYSLADEQARNDIESGSAVTLGTLERYFALFPYGKTFSFNDEGLGISSEDDSASDKESQQQSLTSPATQQQQTPGGRVTARARNRRMDHKELLKTIPGAKNVVFLPFYDHAEEKLIAGCFLWTSVTGRMMSLDANLSYLRAFGNCIVSEVVRMNMQRNEAAKTTFIASMSHELRSPLHGILGAAEFLKDTATDAYQAGLVTSIATCGKTLLDTLNHVLDYSKINKLGRAQMRKHAKANKLVSLTSDSSLESLSMTAEIDLGILVEEVAEAVTAGHSFKKIIPGSESIATTIRRRRTSSSLDDMTTTNSASDTHLREGEGTVSVLLDIDPRRSWVVRIQPGALRRIIMNLLGNALKYTTSGFVAVSLRAQESTGNHKINTLIRVVDSGKGMSEAFQQDRLFVPFSQEDPFQPGTGLGLSIVKQIVDSLGGSVEVRSGQGVGTEIDVHLSLAPGSSDLAIDPEMHDIEQRTRGMHLVLLDPGPARSPTHQVARLEQTLREVCAAWFGMRVTQSDKMDQADADVYLYSEPPPVEMLLERHRNENQAMLPRNKEVPVIIVSINDEDAIAISRNQQKLLNQLGRIVEVVAQPCGPRKLAKALDHCLHRAAEINCQQDPELPEPTPPEDSALEVNQPDSLAPVEQRQLPGSSSPQVVIERQSNSKKTNTDDLGRTMSAAVSYPAPTPLDPETPSLHAKPPLSLSGSAEQETALHILLVDDNKINRQLLVMFMKKCSFSYLEAENGQEALNLYQSSCLPGPQDTSPSRNFDFVLMDISMPVMDGMEATRKIREFEKENGLKRTFVIALTGLASKEAQNEAVVAGIDVFLPKPVKFAELRKLLVSSQGGSEVVGEVGVAWHFRSTA